MTGAVILVLVFAAVGLLAYGTAALFSAGWQTYGERYVAGTERTLDSLYLSVPPQQVLYFSTVVALVAGTLTGLFFGSWPAALPFALAGFFCPRLAIGWLKRRRDARFAQQLVDALIAMGNALKAGYSLPQALELIQREMDHPIRQEFRIVVQEMRLGVTMDLALDHLYERLATEDVDLFRTAVVVSREVGGNLTEVFDKIARTIRSRQEVEGKVRSLTAQGRLQGLIMCLLPAAVGLALYWLRPEIYQPFFASPIGWGCICLILVLETLGLLWIRRIVRIEV